MPRISRTSHLAAARLGLGTASQISPAGSLVPAFDSGRILHWRILIPHFVRAAGNRTRSTSTPWMRTTGILQPVVRNKMRIHRICIFSERRG